LYLIRKDPTLVFYSARNDKDEYVR
jgi:hypothetical protein